MGYWEEAARAARLRRLTAGWAACAPLELGLRVMTLASAGMDAPLPQDVHQDLAEMMVRWAEVRPRGGTNFGRSPS